MPRRLEKLELMPAGLHASQKQLQAMQMEKEGKSRKEIAEHFGTSEKNIGRWLVRVREQERDQLYRKMSGIK